MTAGDVARAVARELNDAAFSRDFVAEMSYRPRYELSEISGLRVTVVPRSLEIANGDRNGLERTYDIDVGVMQKLMEEEVDELDALTRLVEEIADFLVGRRLKYESRCVVREVSIEPLFALEHLDQLLVFTGVCTCKVLVR